MISGRTAIKSDQIEKWRDVRVGKPYWIRDGGTDPARWTRLWAIPWGARVPSSLGEGRETEA
jgi:hypothetical protein